MNRLSICRPLCSLTVGVLLGIASPFAHADHWTTPTPEELSMTSQPEVPGAAAVYLDREEITIDEFHMFSTYVRLKVLTEKGKEYANVELGYASSEDGGSVSVDDIEGRTIHSDGTIIPFTGKPYSKLIEKGRGTKYMAKVFTLPDVQVGSIIEYRYKRHLDDNYFMAPRWYIQSDLFTRKAHYEWKPTDKTLVTDNGHGKLTNTISWTPILPPDTKLDSKRMPDGRLVFDLDVHNIPPTPEEDYMPPIASLSYRVLFYYSPYRTGEEFWKDEGKSWSKTHDKFIGPGSAVKAAVQSLTAPSDTPDQKLRKLYAAVMQLENTDYTRERTKAEVKADGQKQIHSTDDVWNNKRGSRDQISDLFVAMARAAGMKAYVMAVTNRDRNLFLPMYLSLSQLDDDIAIVNIDGKDMFFDPGSRYCPYGHLEWKHSSASGLRQVDGGTAIATAPPESFKTSHVDRIADLKMDEQGEVTGIVRMSYTGSPALHWRHAFLTGDLTSLKRDLRTSVEKELPSGVTVELTSLSDPADYEKPLEVRFSIKGQIGSSTGKRLLIPADLFEVNTKPAFPHDKRTVAVYFDYPSMSQDVVRIIFPAAWTLESKPSNISVPLQTYAVYDMSAASTPNSIIIRRDYALGNYIFLPKEYSDLRSFYSKMETKDQESIVLKTAAPAAPQTVPAAN
ncbi:MAG TPA: DUF3857 and transglutaminase domain-containing protein [Edaphobacter sp.]|nr:DUF3857 and transglutaminase domain-containing protein [Edaphobacter sp.]